MPLYLLAWAAMPGDSSARGLGRSRRSAVEVALGVGLLAISAMLALRGMGLWISDAVTWPLALVAGGVALLWRGGIGARPPAPAERTPVAAVPAPVEPAERVANVSRQGLGAALLVAAGPRVPAGHGRAERRARRHPRRARRGRRPRAHLRAVDAAAGALAHRRARRAHPLAGARRDGRAPARLGAADARAHPEARRRPARGRGARPRARSASCARWLYGRCAGRGRAARLAAALEAAAAEVERDAPRPGRGRRGRRLPLDDRVRGARRRGARGDGQRGASSARAARSPSTPRSTTTGRRCSSATAAPGFDPRRVAADRRGIARVDRRADGAPRRHADGAPPRPARGTEVELTMPRSARHDAGRARRPRRRPRTSSAPACAPSSASASRSSARPRTSTRRSR